MRCESDDGDTLGMSDVKTTAAVAAAERRLEAKAIGLMIQG